MKPQQILDEILVNYLHQVRALSASEEADSNSLRVVLATLEKFDWLNIAPDSDGDALAAVRQAVDAKRAARKARQVAQEDDSLH